jgi:hypothetical protein
VFLQIMYCFYFCYRNKNFSEFLTLRFFFFILPIFFFVNFFFFIGSYFKPFNNKIQIMQNTCNILSFITLDFKQYKKQIFYFKVKILSDITTLKCYHSERDKVPFGRSDAKMPRGRKQFLEMKLPLYRE